MKLESLTQPSSVFTLVSTLLTVLCSILQYSLRGLAGVQRFYSRRGRHGVVGALVPHQPVELWLVPYGRQDCHTCTWPGFSPGLWIVFTMLRGILTLKVCR